MQDLNFKQAQFLKSCALYTQLPIAGSESRAEVVFAGRSNVGKSSALNALTGQKSLARTSKTPGRTQLFNYFTIIPEVFLVDLPGYGYAKVNLQVQKKWEAEMQHYFMKREVLRGMVLLVDCRHALKDVDAQMMTFANHLNIPIHILLTKSDKLSNNKALQMQKKMIQIIEAEHPDLNVTLQLFSATNKVGLDVLEDRLSVFLNASDVLDTMHEVQTEAGVEIEVKVDDLKKDLKNNG